MDLTRTNDIQYLIAINGKMTVKNIIKELEKVSGKLSNPGAEDFLQKSLEILNEVYSWGYSTAGGVNYRKKHFKEAIKYIEIVCIELFKQANDVLYSTTFHCIKLLKIIEDYSQEFWGR